jgi:hypothetical protein
VCGTSSLFVHVTEVPFETVIEPGPKAMLYMTMVFGAFVVLFPELLPCDP